jgi:uncharacterized membrane protein YiaA
MGNFITAHLFSYAEKQELKLIFLLFVGFLNIKIMENQNNNGFHLLLFLLLLFGCPFPFPSQGS